MKRKMIIICLLVAISAMAFFLWGCPPPVVYVRPPEPRVEVYEAPPHSETVWIPGYWRHSRGEWVWIPGHWARPPRPHAVWVPGHWEPRGGG
jgi:hypothetical protein